MWLCTYHVKWPEDMKFLARDFTKQSASNKAALAALTWLRQNEKITDKGAPIVYDKNQIKTLTKQTIPTISLNSNTLEAMNKIVNIYQNKMLPLLEMDKEVIDDGNNEVEDKKIVSEIDSINLNVKKQRYISLEKYLAKEKVELPISSYK